MAGAGSTDHKLPDLRFVPVESLVPHEQPDDHRLQALVRRIREQAVLKNPPVVAPLDAEDGRPERYMVLDGANRATAARAAGLPHIVVQVVPYIGAAVQLTTWYHALGDFPREALEGALRAIPGLECRPTALLHARAMLARREALAFIAYPANRATSLHGGHDITERNHLLNAVVDVYQARGKFYRVASDLVEELKTGHPEITAVVVFPHFEPAEILELATAGERLPAGITRHLIRWRALRVNVPLERLADTTLTLEQKNEWLESTLRERLNGRQVRFYEESTVLFDE
jgi:hypothetical protein